MLHTLLIALHAVGGLVALAAGLAVLRPPDRAMPPLFRLYLGALWAMIVFLALVVGTDWPSLDTSSRALFGALTIFAVFIGAPGWAAHRNARQPGAGWERRYLENVGFTLIALFDGFVIVAALDLGAPVWLVILAGAGGMLGGRLVIYRERTRLLPPSVSAAAAHRRGSLGNFMKGMTER
jgi:hypothetical protein